MVTYNQRISQRIDQEKLVWGRNTLKSQCVLDRRSNSDALCLTRPMNSSRNKDSVKLKAFLVAINQGFFGLLDCHTYAIGHINVDGMAKCDYKSRGIGHHAPLVFCDVSPT